MTAQIPDRFKRGDMEGETFIAIPNELPAGVVEAPHEPASPPPEGVDSWLARLLADRINSTACWRGYVAVWRLDGTWLYLEHIRGRFRLDSPGPVPATWVTDRALVQHGGTAFLRQGWNAIPNHCLALQFEAGRLIQEHTWTAGRDAESAAIAFKDFILQHT